MSESSAYIVLGAGGHAAVTADLLLQRGYVVQGFVGPEDGRKTGPFGLPILGDDDWLAGLSGCDINLVNGIGSVRPSALRANVYRRFVELGFRFPALVHPGAILSPRAALGEGAQIMAGAVVQPGTDIGVNSIVNTGALVDHDCRIGDHVHIAPGAVLSGGVCIGDGAHIGTGARLIQNIEVGSTALVAAGAVVVRPVEAGTAVAGVPANRMKS